MTSIADAYSGRAREYSELLGSMDAVHPSDRLLIDRWLDLTSGQLLDAGCGPGHWTDYIARRGFDVCGLDLVPTFIEHARATYPGAEFAVGTIDHIEADDRSFGGVLAWYSTIHHAPEAVRQPIAEFARVLRPNGWMVLGFFDGDVLEPFDHAVATAYRWPSADMVTLIEAAGFDAVEVHRRHVRGERRLASLLCRRAGDRV